MVEMDDLHHTHQSIDIVDGGGVSVVYVQL